MTCRWCTNGNCLLCQLKEDTEAGVSSLMGRLNDFKHDVPGDLEIEEVFTQAPRCPLCGARYKELMLHYRHAHPGVRLELRR